MHIVVTNMRENEVVTHSLVLLEGRVENVPPAKQTRSSSTTTNVAYIQASAMERSDSDSDASSPLHGLGHCWPIVPELGLFKAFVLLPAPGSYTVRLQVASTSLLLNMRFVSPSTKYVVRFHYQKPLDSNQGFDAPPETDNSDAAAIERIKLNALMLQTALAELLHRAGSTRRSFALELGSDGLPIVQLLRSQYSTARAQSMDDAELVTQLHHDVQLTESREARASSIQDDSRASQQRFIKHVVILGGAHFDKRTRELFGHRELVDGNLVVFGSCGLHTWPRGLEDLTASCIDNTRFIPRVFLRDCAGRGSYWTTYAASSSRLLQLVVQSFGLETQREGILRTGFSALNRLLCVFEPTALVHVPTFMMAIGDGRFSFLDLAALVAADRADDDLFLDASSVDALAVKCAWIASRRRRRSSSFEPRKSAAAA